MRRRHLIRFCVLNLILVFILATAAFAGLLQRPFVEDTSHVTWLITAIFAAGLIAAFRRKWGAVRWLAWMAVNVGLAGTVLGIIITVTAVSGGDSTNVQQILQHIAVGSGTALWTNLTGCVTYIWLSANAYLVAGEDI